MFKDVRFVNKLVYLKAHFEVPLFIFQKMELGRRAKDYKRCLRVDLDFVIKQKYNSDMYEAPGSYREQSFHGTSAIFPVKTISGPTTII